MISIDAGQNEKGSCDKMQKQLVVSALFLLPCAEALYELFKQARDEEKSP